MRIILLMVLAGACLIFSSCKKGGSGGVVEPGFHGNVSGTIAKVSYSSTAKKSSVYSYEVDLSGRVLSIAVSNEDSTSGVTSTPTQRFEFQYEGTDDKPKSYWNLVRNAAQQYDTIYRVYNSYNGSNQLTRDSAIWIAYQNSQLYIIQNFSYSGNWIVSKRMDISIASVPRDTTNFVDSMTLVSGNLTYDGFYNFGHTASTVQDQSISQLQFDSNTNPLGKLNVAKYIFDRYHFSVYNKNSPTTEKITIPPSVVTQYRYEYDYSDNNYPVYVYQYQVNGSSEILYRTIKYVYQ